MIRLIFWVSIFGLAVAMATSHVITGRYILIFGLNSFIIILSFSEVYSLPPYGNDIA